MTTSDTTHPYTGVFPIAPTPFNEDESLDLPGQKRVLDCMVDQGVDGICILANYSEQFHPDHGAGRSIEWGYPLRKLTGTNGEGIAAGELL